MVEGSRKSGAPFVMDLKRDIVMGHEFCAEVVDYGPQTQKQLKPGTRLSLDLRNVSFADREGVALLRRLADRRVEIWNALPFIGEQIRKAAP